MSVLLTPESGFVRLIACCRYYREDLCDARKSATETEDVPVPTARPHFKQEEH